MPGKANTAALCWGNWNCAARHHIGSCWWSWCWCWCWCYCSCSWLLSVGATFCAPTRRCHHFCGGGHKWKTFSVSTQRYPIFFLLGQNTCMFFFSQHTSALTHAYIQLHIHLPLQALTSAPLSVFAFEAAQISFFTLVAFLSGRLCALVAFNVKWRNSFTVHWCT